MILNGLTSRNPVNLNQVGMEPGNSSTSTYPPTTRILIQQPASNETETCESVVMHKVQFSTNHQWNTGQESMHVVFEEIFLIFNLSLFGSTRGPNNHLWKLRHSVYHSAVLETSKSETMHFQTYADINNFITCISGAHS
jgi:hypothetical protein